GLLGGDVPAHVPRLGPQAGYPGKPRNKGLQQGVKGERFPPPQDGLKVGETKGSGGILENQKLMFLGRLPFEQPYTDSVKRDQRKPKAVVALGAFREQLNAMHQRRYAAVEEIEFHRGAPTRE